MNNITFANCEDTAVTATYLQISNSQFVNFTTQAGGAVVVDGTGELYAENCTFANISAGYGGGIYIANGGVARIHSCLFANNTAGSV